MKPDAPSPTYDLSLLNRSAERWRLAPGLRLYYHDLLADVLRRTQPGPVLGTGFRYCRAIRELNQAVVTSDVALTPHVDRMVTAYEIEKTNCAWGAIVAVDVLHHLCEPLRFFESAARSLQPGGRIVLAEPAATALGRMFYRCFHHEPCRPGELKAPWVFSGDPRTGEFANMGMAWALFVREREATVRRLAELGLTLREVNFRDGLTYPATGGLSKRQLLPVAAIRGLLRFERLLPQWFWRRCALRMIVVLEKSEAKNEPGLTANSR